MQDPAQLEQALTGSLLGLALGDALGLAREGLSPARAGRLFPDRLAYGLIGPYGLGSDDSEHACMTAAALLAEPEDPERFARRLAWKLRWWLLGLPAGVGLATLRACCKLWLGFSPVRSGVVSAGNGPAMRAPVLGVALGHDPARLSAYVSASTALTHRDPRALAGALAVALAAWQASRGLSDPAVYREALHELCPDQPEFLALIDDTLARLDEPVAEVMARLGCATGISGYMLHTVPAVLWLRFRYREDFTAALQTAIACGGDTDTVAAILGGILGAGLSPDQLPERLLKGHKDWPRSLAWMRRLASGLAQVLVTGHPGRAPALNALALLLRNLLFMLIVLAHGFRRLLPPY